MPYSGWGGENWSERPATSGPRIYGFQLYDAGRDIKLLRVQGGIAAAINPLAADTTYMRQSLIGMTYNTPWVNTNWLILQNPTSDNASGKWQNGGDNNVFARNIKQTGREVVHLEIDCDFRDEPLIIPQGCLYMLVDDQSYTGDTIVTTPQEAIDVEWHLMLYWQTMNGTAPAPPPNPAAPPGVSNT